MSDTMSIGELAQAAGVPSSTIRYYERRGLLMPTERSDGNYRLFDSDALERLHFIRAAQEAGFTLQNIATLLEFRDGDVSPCGEVQEMIALRLVRLRDELNHLHEVEALLKRWLRVCRSAERTGRCGVLDHLRET